MIKDMSNNTSFIDEQTDRLFQLQYTGLSRHSQQDKIKEILISCMLAALHDSSIRDEAFEYNFEENNE